MPNPNFTHQNPHFLKELTERFENQLAIAEEASPFTEIPPSETAAASDPQPRRLPRKKTTTTPTSTTRLTEQQEQERRWLLQLIFSSLPKERQRDLWNSLAPLSLEKQFTYLKSFQLIFSSLPEEHRQQGLWDSLAPLSSEEQLDWLRCRQQQLLEQTPMEPRKEANLLPLPPRQHSQTLQPSPCNPSSGKSLTRKEANPLPLPPRQHSQTLQPSPWGNPPSGKKQQGAVPRRRQQPCTNPHYPTPSAHLPLDLNELSLATVECRTQPPADFISMIAKEPTLFFLGPSQEQKKQRTPKSEKQKQQTHQRKERKKIISFFKTKPPSKQSQQSPFQRHESDNSLYAKSPW